MAAHDALLRAAAFGTRGACVLVASHAAATAQPAPPPVLTLECRVSGGGYAIRDAGGRVLRTGDGAPFSPAPRAVLRITASPPLVQVVEGALPHPDCARGPVLDSFAPVRFTWCQARYEILPGGNGEHTLRSTSSTVLETGPHRGQAMEAFIVGRCS